MVELFLKRVSDNGEHTSGVFVLNQNPVSVCLERPWINNQKDISCIPLGSYPCRKISPTDKFGYIHFAVDNVPGRENIRIHRGNTAHDTEGCLLAARQFTPHGVILSEMALDDMIKILPDTFTLTITES